MKDERVLCVRREALPQEWLQLETALKLSEKTLFDILQEAGGAFRLRSQVESDRRWKQIIPYVLMWVPRENLVGCYARRGSEARLHGLESVGIGGHVIEADARGFEANPYAAVRHGMMREISEEFEVFSEFSTPAFCGVINEEHSAVGEVHLGLVYRLQVTHPERVLPGQELGGFRWLSVQKAAARPLELWSRLALSLLPEVRTASSRPGTPPL